MKKNLLVSASVFVAATLASNAMALEIITKSRAVKGYGKRDRDFPVSSETISPSQIHEVYGTRVDAGLNMTAASSKLNGQNVKATSPGVSARGIISGDILTVGLAGARSEIAGRDDSNIEAKERLISKKFIPTLAATFADQVTLGVSSELNWMEIRQNSDVTQEQILNGYSRREAIGLSYHTSKWEAGVMHTTVSNTRATTNDTINEPMTLGLDRTSSDQSANDRDLYVPASNSFYARGNVTPNVSFQGTVSHSQYDANVEGSKATFADYRRADRLGGQLQAVYWLDNEATRFSATASYQGAANAPYGTEDNTLGYRDANLYGGAVDAVFDVGSQAYIGLRVSHLRGERDQDVENYRIAAREERTTIGTTLSKTF